MLTNLTKDLCNNYWIFKFINMFFHLLPLFPLRVSSPIQEIGTNQFLISHLGLVGKKRSELFSFTVFPKVTRYTLMKSEITPGKPIYNPWRIHGTGILPIVGKYPRPMDPVGKGYLLGLYTSIYNWITDRPTLHNYTLWFGPFQVRI